MSDHRRQTRPMLSETGVRSCRDTSSRFSVIVSCSSLEHSDGAKTAEDDVQCPCAHAQYGVDKGYPLPISFDTVLPWSGELRETIAEKWEEISLQLMHAGIGQRLSRLFAVARSEGGPIAHASK